MSRKWSVTGVHQTKYCAFCELKKEIMSMGWGGRKRTGIIYHLGNTKGKDDEKESGGIVRSQVLPSAEIIIQEEDKGIFCTWVGEEWGQLTAVRLA